MCQADFGSRFQIGVERFFLPIPSHNLIVKFRRWKEKHSIEDRGKTPASLVTSSIGPS